MIRRGRQEGWLKLSLDSLPPFLRLNNIETENVVVHSTPDRGNALVAKRHLSPTDNPVVAVPSNVILSKESIRIHAQADRRLQEVLDACGDFASTTRHNVLIFLLLQATYSCPAASHLGGVQHAFANYIKFLPSELLPTFWSEDELELIEGTTLKPAHDAKMHSLYREYNELAKLTSVVPWCRDIWWDEVDGLLEIDDWKQVDAMYRSRALEFPGLGDVMVPYIGFANHASGEATIANYQADGDGNALLLLDEDKTLGEGQEVTITYGDEKGACEMIFSYGFLEDGMEDANTLFLDLSIPESDPLKRAKQAWDPCAPGVRLTMADGQARWESDFIWLVIVNKEDGLEFTVRQTVDGERELRLYWQDEHVIDMGELVKMIRSSSLSDVFALRAAVLLEIRVSEQLDALSASDQRANEQLSTISNVRGQSRQLAEKLRWLEHQLLEHCMEYLARQKAELAASESVQAYLTAQQARDAEDDDFS